VAHFCRLGLGHCRKSSAYMRYCGRAGRTTAIPFFDPRLPPPSDHPATSLGPGCAIATRPFAIFPKAGNVFPKNLGRLQTRRARRPCGGNPGPPALATCRTAPICLCTPSARGQMYGRGREAGGQTPSLRLARAQAADCGSIPHVRRMVVRPAVAMRTLVAENRRPIASSNSSASGQLLTHAPQQNILFCLVARLSPSTICV
jgi:hypothetical protein